MILFRVVRSLNNLLRRKHPIKQSDTCNNIIKNQQETEKAEKVNDWPIQSLFNDYKDHINNQENWINLFRVTTSWPRPRGSSITKLKIKRYCRTRLEIRWRKQNENFIANYQMGEDYWYVNRLVSLESMYDFKAQLVKLRKKFL